MCNRKQQRAALLALLMSAATAQAGADGLDQLLDLDLDQLMNLTVSSASGVPESLRDAPASMVVVTADDIRNRGYDNLVEVLNDLPGFDVAVAGGTNYATAWQRGYRSPFGQRTLLMVDGIVVNELWSQAPDFSRQYPLLMLERIEVLYGPASAVYGANAFAGVINLITRSAMTAGPTAEGRWRARAGSYHTRSIEGVWRQALAGWKLAGGLRLFGSEDPGIEDLKGRRGFVSGDWLRDARAWGPVLARREDGHALGEYHDPARDGSLALNLQRGDWQAGVLWWRATEGYGQEYATDRAQVNVPWSRERAHVYLEHRDPVGAAGQLTTRAVWRHSREWGEWAEAEPDWNPGREAFSYVSWSQWNTRSRSWQLEQKLDLPTAGSWRWLGGWRLERRELAKAYSICGYWEPQAWCPDDPGLAPGASGFGPWVVPSTDAVLPDSPGVPAGMDPGNRVRVNGGNAHVQGVWERDGWRATLGLLYDHHGVYGNRTTPRLALARDFSPRTTLKLLYGEAWQEPATMQVHGGWNGRNANPGLRPETAANTELVLMHGGSDRLHELSLYQAHYGNAIREDAVNASGRRVEGAEYRGRFAAHPWGREWTGYLYYTWTRARDDQHFDPASGNWVDGEEEIGDIARHKLQLGVNIALAADWALNLRGRYIGRRSLYSGNPLRARGETLDPFATADLQLSLRRRGWTLAASVNNVFDTGYEHPGIAYANAGDDTTQRSVGYYNSVLPQDGRSLYLSIGREF